MGNQWIKIKRIVLLTSAFSLLACGDKKAPVSDWSLNEPSLITGNNQMKISVTADQERQFAILQDFLQFDGQQNEGVQLTVDSTCGEATQSFATPLKEKLRFIEILPYSSLLTLQENNLINNLLCQFQFTAVHPSGHRHRFQLNHLDIIGNFEKDSSPLIASDLGSGSIYLHQLELFDAPEDSLSILFCRDWQAKLTQKSRFTFQNLNKLWHGQKNKTKIHSCFIINKSALGLVTKISKQFYVKERLDPPTFEIRYASLTQNIQAGSVIQGNSVLIKNDSSEVMNLGLAKHLIAHVHQQQDIDFGHKIVAAYPQPVQFYFAEAEFKIHESEDFYLFSLLPSQSFVVRMQFPVHFKKCRGLQGPWSRIHGAKYTFETGLPIYQLNDIFVKSELLTHPSNLIEYFPRDYRDLNIGIGNDFGPPKC